MKLGGDPSEHWRSFRRRCLACDEIGPVDRDVNRFGRLPCAALDLRSSFRQRRGFRCSPPKLANTASGFNPDAFNALAQFLVCRAQQL